MDPLGCVAHVATVMNPTEAPLSAQSQLKVDQCDSRPLPTQSRFQSDAEVIVPQLDEDLIDPTSPVASFDPRLSAARTIKVTRFASDSKSSTSATKSATTSEGLLSQPVFCSVASRHSTALMSSMPSELPILKPRRTAVWLGSALITMCLQSAPLVRVRDVCFHPNFPKQEFQMWVVSLHHVHAVFLPWFSACFMASIIDHRGRFSAASSLQKWALSYAVAAYFTSLLHMYSFALSCSYHPDDSDGAWFMFLLGACLFTLVMNVASWAILGRMAMLKLRMLSLAEPRLALVGRYLFWTHVFLFALTALMSLTKAVFEEPQLDSRILVVDLIYGAVIILASLCFFAFFGVVIMAMRRTAKMALAASAENNANPIEARIVHRSALHIGKSAAFTAASAATTFLAILAYTAAVESFLSPRLEWICLGISGVLDVVVNSVCIGLLSGRFTYNFGSRRMAITCTESTKLKVVSRSSAELQEKRIREKLLEAMDPQSRMNTTTAATLAALVGSKDPNALVSEAVRRFRCISWDTLHANPQLILQSGPLDGQTASSEFFQLSHRCKLFECDAFFSHSWHDDEQQKWAALTTWCETFHGNNNRPPKLWFDKACINQTNIAEDLECLPIFLTGCKSLLVISGLTYTSRLWCVMELFVYVIIRDNGQQQMPSLITLGECQQQKHEIELTWSSFDAGRCSCFNPDDKTKIMAVIESSCGSIADFNGMVTAMFASSAAAANKLKRLRTMRTWLGG